MKESESDVREKEAEEDEEYVLLDLDGVSDHVQIPPNAPYVLSGLDTLNPLTIDNKIKLVCEGLSKFYCSIGSRKQECFFCN
ncbi:UNVERIFIED_CONTAM: hypothetical protein Sangu_2855800 [Sesamum angustifolium]|uniref:Transcription factor TFIIIC triple barrel domain-containing protein n=1 Tax=Sesamum angustifolium TaxID=2727405 RepID=A0AAW2IPM6_9LAMI